MGVQKKRKSTFLTAFEELKDAMLVLIKITYCNMHTTLNQC